MNDEAHPRATPTLFEWAGGAEALRRLMDAFYDRVETDELLSHYFPGVSARSIEVMSLRGGAKCSVARRAYGRTRRLPGDARAPSRPCDHCRRTLPLRILMSLAADDAGLPDDPEFRSALVAYLEWATRIALHNSQPGADVVERAPVPRWGWGEAPPYQPT